MKLNVLFVDDNPRVLDGLRRMFHNLTDRWELFFATGGDEALQLLARNPCDVVVADVRMPFMDGVSLLKEIKENFPRTTRIVLSGQSELISVLRTVGSAHQYLSKPCSRDLLQSTIERTNRLRELLRNGDMEDIIVQTEALPPLPTLYLQLAEQLKSEDASLREVSEIISRDMSMSVKILQLVNSAFFGIPRQIVNLEQAVGFLGLETIKGLILGLGIFSQFEISPNLKRHMSRLWNHSLDCATLARGLARTEKLTQYEADECFTAALIHDIGKLVLCARIPERFEQILEHANRRQIPQWKSELELLEFTHAEIGAYLIGLWGLPPCLFEVAAYHHQPAGCPLPHRRSLCIVRFADYMEQQLSGEEPHHQPEPELAADFADLLKRREWADVCRQMLVRETSP